MKREKPHSTGPNASGATELRQGEHSYNTSRTAGPTGEGRTSIGPGELGGERGGREIF
jgi:hypothetical protein